jgi:xylan 1,4-beta-xylosidase
MQLMCDAIAVLGSRHGILMNPGKKECGIIRFDRFDELPLLHLRAGAIINGKEYVFPLCPEGTPFSFFDQRITPCTMSLIGIHAQARLKFKLTFVTPFRPKDRDFSITPVIAVRLSVKRLKGGFRWERGNVPANKVTLFIGFNGPALSCRNVNGSTLDLFFTSRKNRMKIDGAIRERVIEKSRQHDRVISTNSALSGKRFSSKVAVPKEGEAAMDLAWCAHNPPSLTVQGKACPFRYADRFKDIGRVAEWAKKNLSAIFDNARNVDNIILSNNCPKSVSNLMSLSLHAWLINTWWVNRAGKEWFSVWEGNCYFHSTVDVEYTQAPFYLSVWPELLKIELDFWTEYSKDGMLTLGERGKGTLFLSHDAGWGNEADHQIYPHEMEVEESTNYIILAYCHYKRTGDDSILRSKAAIIEKYLAFIAACDTTGSGVPDKGVANTIDDASPAIQFGKQQIYLAIKVLAAYETGAEILNLAGKTAAGKRFKILAAKIRKIVQTKGWKKDHFVTLLDKSAKGVVNPWTHEKLKTREIPGWDSAHIYTVNGLALLDMVGFDLNLDEKKIRKDLLTATQRCLKEYGCVHSDFIGTTPLSLQALEGLAGSARNPGWISMNMLRDMAAFYRGINFLGLSVRYWEWQVTVNCQEPKIFFETFSGNNLCFYPRGIAIWGFFDALKGRIIDKVRKIDRTSDCFPFISVPNLEEADWKRGRCRLTGETGTTQKRT